MNYFSVVNQSKARKRKDFSYNNNSEVIKLLKAKNNIDFNNYKKFQLINETVGQLDIFNCRLKGGSSPGLLNTISDITMNEGETITYQLPEFTDYVTHPDLSDNVLQATSSDGDLSGNYYLDLSLNDLSDNFGLTDLSLNDLSLNDLSLNDLSDNIFFDKDFLTSDGDKLYYSAKLSDGTDLPSWITFSNGTFNYDPEFSDLGSYQIMITVTDSLGSITTTTFNINVIDSTAPIITSGTTGNNLDENSGAGQTVYTITATDAIGVVSYAIGGTDSSLLTLTDNIVTLNANPDYEDKNSYSFTVSATDAAGNTSEAVEVTFEIDDVDDTAPDAPIFTSTDLNTNNKTPTITGTAEPGSTVKLYIGSILIGSDTVGEDGNFSITSSIELATGSYALFATATDANNNISSASSLSLTIDTSSPDAPIFTTINKTINETTLTIEGNAEGGSSVKLYNGATLIGSVTADASNEFSITLEDLTDGSYYITATATDDAGNTSSDSSVLEITIDTNVPDAPTFTTTAIITNNTTPTITGTAETGTFVKLFNENSQIGNDIASADSFSITLPTLSEGDYTLTATATDDAGNTSSVSSALSLTIDTTAPTMTITSSTVSSGDTTNDSSIELIFAPSEATSDFTNNNLLVTDFANEDYGNWQKRKSNNEPNYAFNNGILKISDITQTWHGLKINMNDFLSQESLNSNSSFKLSFNVTSNADNQLRISTRNDDSYGDGSLFPIDIDLTTGATEQVSKIFSCSDLTNAEFSDISNYTSLYLLTLSLLDINAEFSIGDISIEEFNGDNITVNNGSLSNLLTVPPTEYIPNFNGSFDGVT